MTEENIDVNKNKNIKNRTPNKGKKYLESFNLEGVILKDCHFKKQFDEIFTFYLDIPDDSLLYGFRERAGLKATGKSLGGWYKLDFGNTFGQLLSAFARYYSITKDKRFLRKIENLLYEWGKTIEPDGFFFYSKNAVYHYAFDKMAGGLVDVYQYTGIEDAIIYLDKITSWAEKNLSRKNIYADNDCCFDCSAEWYTLPENLYRAYVITGNKRFKDFGDKFLYKDYYIFFERNDYEGLMNTGGKSVSRRYHAYSHINALSSAAMFYYLTGEKKYLQVLKNAYNIIKDTQLYNTGGYGPGETFMYPSQRTETLYSEDFHFETACGSWAIFKLVRYLMEFSGNAIYGDWAEKVIYNGVGAMPLIKPNGEVMYFSNYNINGGVKETCQPWSCCTGTYPLDMTEYYNQIYYYNNNGIYINLFLPSKVKYKKDNYEIILNQDTEFPNNNITNISISVKKPINFKIGIRIPEWITEDLIIEVNKVPTSFKTNNGWAEIEKKWNNNDRIKVSFPSSLKLVSLEEDKKYPATLMYGPVVLASHGVNNLKYSKKDLENIRNIIKKNPQKELSYSWITEEGINVVLEPFYKIKENKKYYIYYDPISDLRIDHNNVFYGPGGTYWKVEVLGHPVMVRKEMANSSMKFDARIFKNKDWAVKLTGCQTHISLKPGAYFEIEFLGKGISWIGNQLQFGGKADIYIDNTFIETVDQYGPLSGIPWIWEVEDLKYGKHKFKVLSKGEKSSESKGFSINVKHLTVLK